MINAPILRGDDSLIPLNPAHIKASRILAAIMFVFPVIGAGVTEYLRLFPAGAVIVPVVIIAVYAVWTVPIRKYNRWGYYVGDDRIRIVRGYLFYCDTVVPFGRIQHIDVEQGPIQRLFGLAVLIIHTAGNHNSTVSLPGLLHNDALVIRDTIRDHIKRHTF